MRPRKTEAEVEAEARCYEAKDRYYKAEGEAERK